MTSRRQFLTSLAAPLIVGPLSGIARCSPAPQKGSATVLRVALMGLGGYASRVAEKLRHERLAASVLTVFLTTNTFKNVPQYSNALTLTLSVATDSTPELIRYGLQGIRKIFRDGYDYQRHPFQN